MADLPMTARRQVRLAVLAALQGARLGCTIDSPGDWNTPSTKLPSILLRCVGDRKAGTTAGQITFTTTVLLEIEARLEANSAEVAQDDLEALSYAIECAVVTNYEVDRIVQKWVAIDSVPEITAEGKRHVGGVMMSFTLEVFEAFDPVYQSPVQPGVSALLEMGIHNDMLGTFDPTGTYQSDVFPLAATPAPRSAGPDGRDEGALDIVLTQ
jgi:hypothetical protein